MYERLRVDRSMTVARPAIELYRIWRDLRRLPEFMSHLESVVPLNETRSRWTARGPGGIEQLTTFKYVVRGNGQVRP